MKNKIISVTTAVAMAVSMNSAKAQDVNVLENVQEKTPVVENLPKTETAVKVEETVVETTTEVKEAITEETVKAEEPVKVEDVTTEKETMPEEPVVTEEPTKAEETTKVEEAAKVENVVMPPVVETAEKDLTTTEPVAEENNAPLSEKEGMPVEPVVTEVTTEASVTEELSEMQPVNEIPMVEMPDDMTEETTEKAPVEEMPAVEMPVAEMPTAEIPVAEVSAVKEEKKEEPTKEVVEDFAMPTTMSQEVDLPLLEDSKPLAPAPVQTELPVTAPPTEKLLGRIDKDVFQEMADLERGNVFLTLQTQKEKLKLDLEKLQSEYRQSRLKEIQEREEVVRKRVEWLQKQEAQRQDILKKEKEIELLTKQSEEAELRKQQVRREAELKRLEEERKQKEAEERRIREEKEAEERRIREEKEAEERRMREEMMLMANPDVYDAHGNVAVPTAGNNSYQAQMPIQEAHPAVVQEEETRPLAQMYRVTEIKGVANALTAKLVSVNKKGPAFLVKRGSQLLTGHTVKRVTRDGIVVELDGKEEQLMVGAYVETDESNASAPSFAAPSMPTGAKGPRVVSFP